MKTSSSFSRLASCQGVSIAHKALLFIGKTARITDFAQGNGLVFSLIEVHSIQVNGFINFDRREAFMGFFHEGELL